MPYQLVLHVCPSGTDSVSAVQSGTWNITNISGTVSLPTGAGAATESTLAALNNKFNTNSFSNINTNTTSTVKSGAGVLKELLLTKLVLFQILAQFTTTQQQQGLLLGRLILFIRKWFLSMIWHLVLV